MTLDVQTVPDPADPMMVPIMTDYLLGKAMECGGAFKLAACRPDGTGAFLMRFASGTTLRVKIELADVPPDTFQG